MGFEIQETRLRSGTILKEVTNGDGRVYGTFSVGPMGAEIWSRVWVDEWKRTGDVFPGPISAIRAIVRGEV